MPGLFVLALGASAALSLVTRSAWWLGVILVPYLCAALLATIAVAARKGWRYLPVLPIAFATMHLAYGIGFLLGMIRFGLRARRTAELKAWTN